MLMYDERKQEKLEKPFKKEMLLRRPSRNG